MALSMSSASLPVLQRMLTNLTLWLDKAAAHADARRFDVDVLLQTRLFPDMLPLVAQVRIACDTAKGCAARLAGQEPPRHEDNEKTWAELKERVAKTLAFIATVPAASIDGSEDRVVTLPRPNKEPLRMRGEIYLRHFALPNLFFHVTTAYALLRHNGVELGKPDFLGIQPGDLLTD